MAKWFNDNSQSIGKTPLVELSARITDSAPARILAKIEGRNPAYSVKCRLGAALIWDAEKKGLLGPGKELVEPTSGNTGIALAFVAAAKGIPLTLTMPETMSIERRKLLATFGAKLVLTEGPRGMGGAIAKVLGIAQKAYDRGDYRWVAELLRHLIASSPSAKAKELQAKAFEQLAYQSESSIWRNIYLQGALELRGGSAPVPDVFGVIKARKLHPFTTAQLLDFSSVRLDGPKVGSKNLQISLKILDRNENYSISVARGVLNYRPTENPNAGIQLSLARPVLDSLLTGELSLDQALASDKAKLQGDRQVWQDFLSLLSTFNGQFPIVTPLQ